MNRIFILSVLLLICSCCCLFAQQPGGGTATNVTVKGIITDSQTRETLIGVSVVQKGTSVATVTDVDGAYTMNAPLNATLVFSYIGYTPQEIRITSGGELNVQLKENNELDEVVVIGYGVQKKSLVTGAISSISSKDLAQTGLMRADQAMQGRVPGVTVMNNSGQPGAAVSIRIRGAGTNNSTDPLYVVDGFIMSSIESLNPGDIESMEILKDAASAAIYGAQGANGVVLITTKKGKDGENRIEYSGSYGIQNPRRYLDLLDAKSYARIQNEAAYNSAKALPYSEEQIVSFGKGTDWQREITNKNAPITNHQLSLIGGNTKSIYSSSLSYFMQEGIFAPGKSKYERYTARLNYESTFLNGLLKIGTNSDVSHVKKQSVASNQGNSGPISSAINIDPITPVYDNMGDFGISPYVATEVVNPVARIYYTHGSSSYTRINLMGFAQLSYKGFTLRSNLGEVINYTESRGYTPLYRLNSSNFTNSTGVSKSMSQNFYYNNDNTLTYANKVNVHNFSAMIGNSVRKGNGTDVSASKQGLLYDDPEYAYIALAKTQGSDGAGGGAFKQAFVSYFGRVSYDFDSRYMMTATYRADGSYRFGPNNRFGYFPSVSAGWNVSNEKFMQNEKWLDMLKARVSWGQTGNDALDDWQYVSTISTWGKTYYFGDNEQAIGAAPGRTANPDLKWETSEQFNIGFDARFLRNFTTTVDLYRKTTKDLLVIIPAPMYIGNQPPWGNAGSVRNQGIEFSLGYRKDLKKDWSIDINGNIAYNQNKVIEVGNENGYITGGSVIQMQNLLMMEPGQPIGYFYLVKTLGVFQNQAQIDNYKSSNGTVIQPKAKPGDLIFKDRNDDGVIDIHDREYCGSPHPKFNFGVNVSTKFKNFDFTMFWTGLIGHKIFNGLRRWDLQTSNFQTTAMNRWHGEGTSNSYPRITADDQNGNFTTASDFFLEDGSFLRLKDISLGYTFQQLNKFNIKQCRVYVSALNLLTFTKYTGYEPEVTGGVLSQGLDRGVYPQPKTFTVGLNLSF
ncbi:TonB-dependent receptor [Dysgonomonas sp. BGC7]|uniref:SusC/RagA family TonB-linked outer membrane protein n=1 Tax=Dysgonomonas sp. BGC7 TaxID=1658008 RepID=UPI0009E35D89|nr:TonB-dependent receptor [Dysgonomonas sp. BGC7]MBD8389350.1 TonB-dependent receptor [Dysgonomonas sp. BGC7]